MTEVAMAEKLKIILVGGMDYNIPDQLKANFEIVKHITQGTKYNSLPKADYVFVLTQWTNHNMVDQVKRESGAPVMWLRHGWSGMKEDLQKRSLLPPEAAPEVTPKASSETTTEAPASTIGLSEGEIWKKFGEGMIEACRAMLKLGERVTEKELLDVLSMAGPPVEDCKLFLPKLQMLGIVMPTKNELWRLASSESEAYEEEPEAAAAPPPRERKRVPAGERSSAEERLRSIPGSPALITKLIAGLPMGPYPTKTAIHREMRKYKEFAGLTDNQVRLAVERAISQKIVDDTHTNLFIDHKSDLQLTKLEKTAVEEAPVVPAKPPPPQDQAVLPPQVAVSKSGLSQQDAERKWCFVVERVKAIRQRVSDILVHCRVEWMDSNRVLAIFIPAALSNCQKFLESMENWGTVSKTVQEQFTRDTVIRFMLDNGLRT